MKNIESTTRKTFRPSVVETTVIGILMGLLGVVFGNAMRNFIPIWLPFVIAAVAFFFAIARMFVRIDGDRFILSDALEKKVFAFAEIEKVVFQYRKELSGGVKRIEPYILVFHLLPAKNPFEFRAESYELKAIFRFLKNTDLMVIAEVQSPHDE